MAGFEFLLKKPYTSKVKRGSWFQGSMVMYRSLLSTGFAYNIDDVAVAEKQIVANDPSYRTDRVKLGYLIADVIDGTAKIPEPVEPKAPKATTKKPTRGVPTKTPKATTDNVNSKSE
jgi:hypothetical protein